MTDEQRPKTDDRRVIKSVRGTRDLLPPETALWNFVEAAVRDVFRVYNFHEIRTPIIEDLALFQRSVGEETDIVGKEMFAWEDGIRISEEKLRKRWESDHPEAGRLVVQSGGVGQIGEFLEATPRREYMDVAA